MEENNENENQNQNNFINYQTNCINSIKKLLNYYENDNYALQKIVKYCNEIMPNAIETSLKLHNEREKRANELKCLSEDYINNFMNTTQYYYFPVSELYVEYIDDKYIPTTEDNITYNILSSLSNNEKLRVWKHKIKTNILKKIKTQKNISIPSSKTIQNMLNTIYPSIFLSKNEAKYFLTFIGDCIFNKDKDNNIFFIHSRAKPFIDYIIKNLNYLIGTNASIISNSIKYKYHNHRFNECRIIRIQGYGNYLSYPQINTIDLYFIAQHYFERYSSSDNFLSLCPIDSPVQHAKYLCDNNFNNIIINFFNKTFDKTTSNITPFVSIKNIQFIWKRFIEIEQIPNILSSKNIVSLLLTRIPELKDCYDDKVFIGYTSKLIPIIDLFLNFWDTNMIVYNDEKDINNEKIENLELEIDEISKLFGSWVRKQVFNHDNYINNLLQLTNAIIDDELTLALIRHYYPVIQIENDKFIHNIKSNIWNKEQEVIEYIENYLDKDYLIQSEIDNSNNLNNYKINDNNISLNDIYHNYCLENKTKSICLVSKQYFERIYNDILFSI